MPLRRHLMTSFSEMKVFLYDFTLNYIDGYKEPKLGVKSIAAYECLAAFTL